MRQEPRETHLVYQPLRLVRVLCKSQYLLAVRARKRQPTSKSRGFTAILCALLTCCLTLSVYHHH